jgi:protein ImuA
MKTDSSYGQVIHLPKRKVSVAQAPVLPALTDVLCTTTADPAATGFLLSSLNEMGGPILWVQDHMSRRESGRIYTPGLPAFGVKHAVLQVHVSHPRDVLWAMEEGASCAGLSAVIGEIHGAPASLDFTATKRLAMRAEASGVPVFLLRSGDPGVLSAARARWRVMSLPSLTNAHDSRAPGSPQWDLDLFRARAQTPGRWVAQYDPDAPRATDRLRLVSRADTGTVDAGDQSVPDRSGG